MEYVKLMRKNSHYGYKGSSSVAMDIIGFFLSDVDCSKLYKEWALADKTDLDSEFTDSIGCNTTFLEDEDGKIILHDAIEDEEVIPHYTAMTKQQFVQLLDDWQEKVCIPRPKEVIIKYENNQYSIETSN